MTKLLLFLLKCVAVLPLRLLYLISDFLYLLIYRLAGYRRKVVRQNLSEAFPEKSTAEIKSIEREFYRFLCDVIVETLKLLHISPKQLGRRVEVTNPEIVNRSIAEGRSAALLLGHYGNWEWVQEISRRLTSDCYRASIYKPLHSRLAEALYRKIRSRWSLLILPMDKAARSLLEKDHRPWICGFIADARPLSREPVTVPFLHHYTSIIVGPEVIGRKVGADFFFLEMERVRRGYYRITFHKLEPLPDGLPYPYIRAFWQQFERVIKKSPAYWLWSHKRWKYDNPIDN